MEINKIVQEQCAKRKYVYVDNTDLGRCLYDAVHLDATGIKRMVDRFTHLLKWFKENMSDDVLSDVESEKNDILAFNKIRAKNIDNPCLVYHNINSLRYKFDDFKEISI